MPAEIDVACPGCNAIFGVPMEFCGETAECAECGTMFEIPTLDEKPDGMLDSTETGAIKGVEADDVGEATNTVRLSRTGIGMIPQVKDSFHLGGPPPSAAPFSAAQQPTGKTFTTRPPSAPAPAPAPSAPAPPAPAAPMAPAPMPTPMAAAEPVAEEEEPMEAAQTEPSSKDKIILPDWTKIRMKKAENVVGIRESSASSGATAFLVSIPVIVSGAVGLAQQYIGGLVVAAVVVGAVWVAVFITAMLMGKSGSKKALVVTNQRAICIIGNERMEVKQ